MADSRAIGIFDSGIGGLSIASHIRALLPTENIIYIADSFYAPYGEKTEEFILQRSLAVTDFLLSQQVKAIVVACNTATMVSIKTLRTRYPLPFIGVEPGVKPASLHTRSGIIGVLATSKTLFSHTFSQLAQRVASDVQIEIQPCPDLVTLIESLQLAPQQALPVIERYVLPLLAKGADTIILGCTHFSHVKQMIEHVAGPDIMVISTEQAVAKETWRRLDNASLLTDMKAPGNNQFFSNTDEDLFHQQIQTLWGGNASLHSFRHTSYS